MSDAGETEQNGHDRFPWDLDGEDWDGTAEDDARRGHRRFLLAAAVIPWLVVVVLALRDGGTPTTKTVPAPRNEPESAATVTATEEPSRHPETSPSGTEALRFGFRPTAGPGHASAIAMLVARDWLGGVGPRLRNDDSPAGRSYVEHLAVEEVDLTAHPYVVVTLAAVVLDVRDETYENVRAVRLAVPVALSHDAARPAGDPWVLPPPDLVRAPPAWQAVDDADAATAAGEALVAVGYRKIDVLSIDEGPLGLLRVHAAAVAPGEQNRREQRIWLRERQGSLVVSGSLPSPVPSSEPAESPGSPRS